MATVTGVRFKKAGKVYYFSPGSVWPQPGDAVVVETARGVEIGETITSAREVPDDQIVSALKPVLRIATAEDIEQAARSAELEREAFEACQSKIVEHRLEMKLVEVEHTFDNSKLIFYFTANGRVDFRDLVKDLASQFKTRIELRQIGVRDEAKMLGGLGACGRSICCGTFLSDFQPVSIKMAKEQNLSLNPTKISGQCGRLMCCLKYEQSFYESILKKLPRVGREVITPDGPGSIVEISALRETVKVRVRFPDDSYDFRVYPIDDVQRPSGNQQQPKQQEKGQAPNGKRDAKNNAPPEESDKKNERRPRPKGPKQSAEQYFEGAQAPVETDDLDEAETIIEEFITEESDFAEPAEKQSVELDRIESLFDEADDTD